MSKFEMLNTAVSRRSVLTGALALGSVAALSGCGGNGDGGSSAAAEITSLEVQFVPTNNDGSLEAKAKPFADYLTEKLGVETNVTLATDYTTIVEAMASGQVQLGIMPPAAYVMARNQGCAEALLTSELGAYDRETGLPIEGELTGTFKGEILVRSDSDMQELTDLKGKKIATLSANSASGYIYPVAELKDAGVDPVTECTLTTVNDIPSEITAVLNGQQDACFVFEGARNVFANSFPDNDLFADLRVLYLTEGDIPNDAIAVQPDMDQDMKDKIKETFLNMANDEEAPRPCPCGATWATPRSTSPRTTPSRSTRRRLRVAQPRPRFRFARRARPGVRSQPGAFLSVAGALSVDGPGGSLMSRYGTAQRLYRARPACLRAFHAMKRGTMIEFKDVSKVYGNGTRGLDHIQLTIGDGEFVSIIGLSGAGKSTLLRSINRLNDVTEGEVVVDGTSITRATSASSGAFAVGSA